MRAGTRGRAVDGADVPRSLPALVDRWLAEGVITPEQARLMLRAEPRRDPAPDGNGARPSPVVIEAAGYLGGALVVVASLLIGARYWGDLGTAARLVVIGAGAAALLVAGALVTGRGEEGRRLTSVLWLGSTAAASGFTAVLVDATSARDEHAPLLVAGATAAWATTLWLLHRVLAQQVAMFVALLASVAAALAVLTTSDSLPGLGVWVVAATWLLLAWRGRLAPRRAVMALAAAAMTVGALITLPTAWGFVLAFLTLAALVALAVRLRELTLLVIAALGALQVLPAAVVEWFPGTVLAPVTLLLVGAVLVGAAVRLTRSAATAQRGVGRHAEQGHRRIRP
jgi:hypothetical protein